MKKIYITGITGLLGSNLVRVMREKYITCGIDRNIIDLYGIHYDLGNILDFSYLSDSIRKSEPDVIIHCAAVVNVDLCEKNKWLAEQMNVHTTREIAELSKEVDAKLIYISTDSVYDGEMMGLHTEEEDVKPVNVYASTKLEGEKYVLDVEDSLVLRTNFYGINIRNKKSFGEWIVDSLLDGQEINMFEDIYFSPILASELAGIIDESIIKNLCGIYNACGTGKISKYDFGIHIQEIFKLKSGSINRANSRDASFQAKRPRNMGMSNKKLCDQLGMEISTPVQSMKRFMEEYNNLKWGIG